MIRVMLLYLSVALCVVLSCLSKHLMDGTYTCVCIYLGRADFEGNFELLQ